MTDRLNKPVSLWMLAGVALGALCGYFLPQVSLALDFVGKLFLGGLKLLVIPVIVTGTIAGVSAFGDARRAGRFSGKVLIYFGAGLVVAVLVSLSLVLMLGPGHGVRSLSQPVTVGGWNTLSEALGSLIPGNLIQAVSEGKYLGVVLLALFLGGMLTAMGAKGRTAVTLFKNIHEGLLRVLALLLLVAPVGLFSLIGTAVAHHSSWLAEGGTLAGSYLLTVTLALLIHGFLLLPAAIWWLGERSPVSFYRKLLPAFFTAFGTSTSVAAFPVTYRCLSEECKVDPRSTALVLPLGTVINLPGTVICMVVATLFSAQVLGVALGPGQILGVAVLAILVSIGAAGVPSATLLAAPVLFGAAGLTAEGVALAIGVVVALDWLVDRLRAVVNVAGDAAGAAVLAEAFDLKTARRTGRERRPSQASRERRSPRTDSRSTGRRRDRTERPAEPTRERGRKSPVSSSDAPSRRRGGRGSSTGSDRTPFQMKTSGEPALGAEGPATPSRRPARAPQAETDSSRQPASRRRSGRSGSAGPSGDRRSRARTRVSADKPVEPRPKVPATEPPKPGPPKPEPPKTEPPKPEPAKPEPPEKVPDKNAGAEEAGRMSPTVVARELAKVSAQLREPDETDPSSDAPSEDQPQADFDPASIVVTPPTLSDPETPEDVVEPAPAGSDVPDAADTERSDDTREESQPEPEGATPQGFGRTRRYKGAALRKARSAAEKEPQPIEAEEAAEPEAEAEPEPETKSEDTEPVEKVEPPEEITEEPMAFGRVKRKRTR